MKRYKKLFAAIGLTLVSGLAGWQILSHAPVASAQAVDDANPDVMVVKIDLVKFDMVKIPGGEIEVPAVDAAGKQTKETTKVTIKPFSMSKTELPWEAYDIYAQQSDLNDKQKATLEQREIKLDKANKSRPSKPYGAPDGGFGHDGYPAIRIQYQGAVRYCQWLSARTGKKFRLPTEAEWEWAASAGGKITQLTGDELEKAVWHSGNSKNDADELQTHPVGQKAENPFGLKDMLGNVSEWCVSMNGKTGVCRGGSYLDDPKKISVKSRSLWQDSWQLRDPQDPKSSWWLSDGPQVGFRVVQDE